MRATTAAHHDVPADRAIRIPHAVRKRILQRLIIRHSRIVERRAFKRCIKGLDLLARPSKDQDRLAIQSHEYIAFASEFAEVESLTPRADIGRRSHGGHKHPKDAQDPNANTCRYCSTEEVATPDFRALVHRYFFFAAFGLRGRAWTPPRKSAVANFAASSALTSSRTSI